MFCISSKSTKNFHIFIRFFIKKGSENKKVDRAKKILYNKRKVFIMLIALAKSKRIGRSCHNRKLWHDLSSFLIGEIKCLNLIKPKTAHEEEFYTRYTEISKLRFL